MKSILFGDSAVSIGDAFYITVVSMLIVFFILFLISFVLSFFKYFSNSENLKQDIVNKNTNDNKILQDSKKIDNEEKFSMEKIKDEGFSLDTPVVISNSEEYMDVLAANKDEIDIEEQLLTLIK